VLAQSLSIGCYRNPHLTWKVPPLTVAVVKLPMCNLTRTPSTYDETSWRDTAKEPTEVSSLENPFSLGSNTALLYQSRSIFTRKSSAATCWLNSSTRA